MRSSRAWTSGMVFVVAVAIGMSLSYVGRRVPALAGAVFGVPVLALAGFGVATLLLVALSRKLRNDAKVQRRRYEALRESEPGHSA
jgi:hypothetical protein